VRILAHAPLILAALGLAKAAAVVWIGPRVGVPAWMVALTAALWITGPATVAWLVAERRRRRSKTRAAAASAQRG
jgi:hypothetical protein